MMKLLHALIYISARMLLEAMVKRGFLIGFRLERNSAVSHNSEVSKFRAHDEARKTRFLQQYGFRIQGDSDVLHVGIYYMRVQIGSPAKEFHVQIDSGSDVSWVDCSNCAGCPNTTSLPIKLGFYDPRKSATASLIPCSDQRCRIAAKASKTACSGHTNHCGYRIKYADGMVSSGQYVSDLLHIEKIGSHTSSTNASAPFFFGCSAFREEGFTSSILVDGVFGFGQTNASVISQLARNGITPKAFAHCLRGGDVGSGVLLIGEVMETNVVYTPLVPSKSLYSINLESISVNGGVLPVEPSVFATPRSKGAIVDSGTSLTYLPEPAYKFLITAITTAVNSKSAKPFIYAGFYCWALTYSVNDTFPSMSINFKGGASLVLNPQDYLLNQTSADAPAGWCVGFQETNVQGITILGDLVKIVIYDLENQRIGWLNYNCSLPVNVFGFNGGNKRRTGPSWTICFGLVISTIMAIFLHL